MLKIETIKFKDQKNRTYEIKKNQIETFPLTGGEDADMVTTQVWNQHGNTPTNAFMEAFEGELVFAIFTKGMSPEEIKNARRKVADICNPLNGILRMEVTLNNNETFNRDITFVSAPIFPTGHENRNRAWQKVQLLYSANNPFWYSQNEIVESFQGVEPLFTFPFELPGVIFGNVIPNKIAVNEGQVQAPVIIEINGYCINPEIKNATTGEFIRFKDLTMNTGDKLIIDTSFGQKRVELNGENVFNKLDFSSTFFNLKIGENSIDFSDETGSQEARISFIYKNLYITI